MKLATLKAAERAAFRLMKAYEAEEKHDLEAKRLREEASKLWMERRKAHHNAEVAAAKRKDKGEVLFTIFKPDSNSIREIVRTPNLLITQTWWRHSWAPTGFERTSEPHVDVPDKRFHPPAYDFAFYMKTEAA